MIAWKQALVYQCIRFTTNACDQALMQTALKFIIIGFYLSVGTLTGICLFAIIWAIFQHLGICEAFNGIVWPVNSAKIAAYEKYEIKNLLSKGLITSPEAFLSSIISFYSIIITILIAMLSLLGFLTIMHVRSSSKNHAEQTAQEIAKKEVTHFLESNRFSQMFDDKFEDKAADSISRFGEAIERLNLQVMRNEENIEAVKANLSMTDSVNPEAMNSKSQE